ncbi:uridine diphosphate-N-acetylglucosamine-binding protein YvcK [Idiomarina seosinensis]|uniref:gluconeogenesis factor YvcK family protein n=1 Tax=Idiomarina seosinensis TaxID=281739 RepID=UPI00385097E2
MQIAALRRVTAIGGGHGLGRVLSTLAFLNNRLVGVVATTDNGGATGLLRQTHHTIAWGDIRNCLSQLVEQPLAADVLNYRFRGETPLCGHNLGNLLLYTLDQVSARPLDGIQLLSRLLNVNTRLLPMSECPTDLIATTKDGIQCHGELLIDKLEHMPQALQLSATPQATPEAVRHLYNSDLIILGPGSFLTSVLPPLLVKDIAQAVRQSAGKVIFIDNLVHENGPSGQLSLRQKLDFLAQHIGTDVVDLVLSNHADKRLGIPCIGDLRADSEISYRHQTESLLKQLNFAVSALFKKPA